MITNNFLSCRQTYFLSVLWPFLICFWNVFISLLSHWYLVPFAALWSYGPHSSFSVLEQNCESGNINPLHWRMQHSLPAISTGQGSCEVCVTLQYKYYCLFFFAGLQISFSLTFVFCLLVSVFPCNSCFYMNCTSASQEVALIHTLWYMFLHINYQNGPFLWVQQFSKRE